ncbi:hypothetical protein SEA_MABODAMACA_64 [Microbacterium phage Mabodamaca]|uniref:Uncharacterized protein n=1 Tax=Microbacterium phage Mabodamaca TaxID=3078574 RepID=A0AA96NFX4_9CAUD|nr:hypothetical protein SEA_MABODAMACA_64 [Microbacterium phage Mabodamaca]
MAAWPSLLDRRSAIRCPRRRSASASSPRRGPCSRSSRGRPPHDRPRAPPHRPRRLGHRGARLDDRGHPRLLELRVRLDPAHGGPHRHLLAALAGHHRRLGRARRLGLRLRPRRHRRPILPHCRPPRPLPKGPPVTASTLAPAPVLDREEMADRFRRAWHKADAEGRAGARVDSGLDAAVGPARSLLLRLRVELDEVLADPYPTRSELALAQDLDRILREGGVL